MGSTHRRRRLMVGVLFSTALALSAGCSAGQDAAPPTSSPAISLDNTGGGGGAPSAGSDTATTGASGRASKTPAAAAQTEAGGAPLAAGDIIDQGTKLHVAITSLKRGSGDLVTLKFDLTVPAGPSYSTISFGTFNVDAPYLIDPAGQKKYLVVKDTSGTCICSRSDITSGATMSWYTTFPPLPDAVKTVTVVLPLFAPFENVPVS
jgi:hypothetical protein